MRRRRKLEVSTFPFLAVLLCAMGSLILVLLAMDRKAKLAAKAKAELAARKVAEEAELLTAARRAEWERARREQRAARERKRDELHARLESDKRNLEGQMAALRARLAESASQLQAELDGVADAERKAAVEQGKLGGAAKVLEERRSVARRVKSESAAQQAALEKMTADLALLENTLRDLKAARERDRQTYSVVPYRGRRGESRRPLYVECAAGVVIFHPDKVSMRPERASDVLAEVRRRVARQRAIIQTAGGAAEPTPYLLLLVRPDGIPAYYLFQAALRGMEVRYGYEFIDADWVLDFPAEDAPSEGRPWTTVARSDAAAAADPSQRRPQGVVGLKPTGVPLSPEGGAGPPGPPQLATDGSRTARGASNGLPGDATGGSGTGVDVRGAGAAGPGGANGTGNRPGGRAPGGGGGSAGLRTGIRGIFPGVGGDGTATGQSSGDGARGGGIGANSGLAFGSGSGSDSGSGGGPGASSLPGGLAGGGSGSGQGNPGGSFSGASGGGGASAYGTGDGSASQSGTGVVGAFSDGALKPRPAGGAARRGPGGVTSLSIGTNGAAAGPPGPAFGPVGDGNGSAGLLGAPLPASVGSGSGGSPGGNSMSPLLAPIATSHEGTAGQPAGAPDGSRRASWGGVPSAETDGGAAGRLGGFSGVLGQSGGAGGVTPGTVAGGAISGSALGQAAGAPGHVPGPAAQYEGGAQPPGAGPASPLAGVLARSPLAMTSDRTAQPGGGAPSPTSGAAQTAPPYVPGQSQPEPPAGIQPPTPTSGGGVSRGNADGTALPPGPARSIALPVKGTGGADGEEPDAMSRYAPQVVRAPAPRKPATLRPARLNGDRDFLIYAECRDDGVVLYPSQRVYPLADLIRGGALGNPLVQAVQQMIDRRQALVAEGAPPYRPQICFLVHPEGERTYHAAYPALEALPVPKTRRNLVPEDDVLAIVTGR
jgi:hypothetical protein